MLTAKAAEMTGVTLEELQGTTARVWKSVNRTTIGFKCNVPYNKTAIYSVKQRFSDRKISFLIIIIPPTRPSKSCQCTFNFLLEFVDATKGLCFWRLKCIHWGTLHFKRFVNTKTQIITQAPIKKRLTWKMTVYDPIVLEKKGEKHKAEHLQHSCECCSNTSHQFYFAGQTRSAAKPSSTEQ